MQEGLKSIPLIPNFSWAFSYQARNIFTVQSNQKAKSTSAIPSISGISRFTCTVVRYFGISANSIGTAVLLFCSTFVSIWNQIILISIIIETVFNFTLVSIMSKVLEGITRLENGITFIANLTLESRWTQTAITFVGKTALASRVVLARVCDTVTLTWKKKTNNKTKIQNQSKKKQQQQTKQKKGKQQKLAKISNKMSLDMTSRETYNEIVFLHTLNQQDW